MNKSLFGFTFDHEADARESYLVLRRTGLRKHDIIEFQIDMIQSNRIPGIASLEVREKDLEIAFYYRTTGLMSIANYFKRQKISKADFIWILDRVVTVLLKSNKYFLNDTSFVLEEDLIYINPDTKEIFMAYIPLHLEQDIRGAFLSFILNVVVNKVQIDTSDDFVQQVLSLLKEEGFNLAGFLLQLKNLGEKQPGKECEDSFGEVLRVKNLNSREVKNKVEKKVENNFGNNIQSKAEKEIIEDRVGSSIDSKIKYGSEYRLNEKAKAKPLPLRTKVLGILAFLSVLLAIGNNLSTGLTSSLRAKFPVIFALMAGGAILIMFILVKYRGALTKLETSHQGRVNIAKVEFEGKPENTPNLARQLAGFRAARLETGVSSDSMFFSEEVKEFVKSRIDEVNLDETVLLQEVAYPYLKSINGTHKIYLEKTPVILGRNAETCDQLIESPLVGRIHAEVRCNAGEYYIMDLDSRNGTFLNGQRLVSNEEIKIHDNDLISFADNEYIFCNRGAIICANKSDNIRN